MIRRTPNGPAASCDDCGAVALPFSFAEPRPKEEKTLQLLRQLRHRGWTTDGARCRCWRCGRFTTAREK